jgi:hypothetical protein
VIILSGLWQARGMYLCRSYVRLSSQRVLRPGGLLYLLYAEVPALAIARCVDKVR